MIDYCSLRLTTCAWICSSLQGQGLSPTPPYKDMGWEMKRDLSKVMQLGQGWASAGIWVFWLHILHLVA